ncbi:MAG: primase [Caulobacter sp.]|nr:primase [Caulobacter sp.]
MRFDDRFLEELKGRVRPSDVIGRTVKLRRQGREYAGLSPFTKEKTPSFFVNDDKGFFHCFASGKHGDVIAFLQETERLTFVEAVERLAGEAGLSLPAVDRQAARQDARRAQLVDWLEMAATWFEARLRGVDGVAARAYLAGRGVPDSIWSQFRVGFAPSDRTALKDYLVAKGAMPADLVAAGLLIAPDDGGAAYDRFRDRIMFPITDARGRVISFGGRAMDPRQRAKYLNGPETATFSKGRVLYGWTDARALLAGSDVGLIVVEGYLDVIACQRVGVAAVAAMGTALTDAQMTTLWRLHAEPTLCFDGDRAGQAAAGRAIDNALPLLRPGRSFRFAMLADGQDPDDILRQHGADQLNAQLRATAPFVRVLFDRERRAEPLDTPERRAGLRSRLRALAAAIPDRDLAQAYRDDLLSMFEALRPRRGQSAAGDLEGATAEALAAAVAMRRAGDGIEALLALPADAVDDAAAHRFDLYARIDEIESQMQAMRAALRAVEDFEQFKALKVERDGLKRQVRDLPQPHEGVA